MHHNKSNAEPIEKRILEKYGFKLASETGLKLPESDHLFYVGEKDIAGVGNVVAIAIIGDFTLTADQLKFMAVDGKDLNADKLVLYTNCKIAQGIIPSDFGFDRHGKMTEREIREFMVEPLEDGGILNDQHAIEFASGGPLPTTLRGYIETLNVLSLPEKAQKYIAEDILTDDDLDLVGLDDKDVQDLQKIIKDNYPLALGDHVLPEQQIVEPVTAIEEIPSTPEAVVEAKIEVAEDALENVAERLIKQYEIALGQATRKGDAAKMAKITTKLKFLKRALDVVEETETKEDGGKVSPEIEKLSTAYSKLLSFIEHIKTKPTKEVKSIKEFYSSVMALDSDSVTEKDKHDENYLYAKLGGKYLGYFDKAKGEGLVLNDKADGFNNPHSFEEGGNIEMNNENNVA